MTYNVRDAETFLNLNVSENKKERFQVNPKKSLMIFLIEKIQGRDDRRRVKCLHDAQ